MDKMTMHKEFLDPVSELNWSTDGVTQEGATAALVYRYKENGTYCRILRFPEGFHEGRSAEENQKACCFHDFDEVVYIATGGAINRRLGYRYNPGSIAYFPKGVNHGPLETPFGALLVEFRHYVDRPSAPADKNITTSKEFLDPLSEIQWSREGVTQEGAAACLVYRDEESGTYCRILRFPEGFHEGRTPEENQKACCFHDFDEIVYVMSGGVINRRLGYRYPAGSIAVFPAGVSHGPLEAPFGALLLEFRHYRNGATKPESETPCCCCQ